MNLLLILLLGLAIGAVLGGLGGGGAILTVPALVYVVGQPAQDATTSSLVIVGVTALVGVASYVTSRRVRWRIGLAFGAAGIPAAYVGSYLNHRVDGHLLLIGFSVLMVIAAVAMVGARSRRGEETGRPDPVDRAHQGPAPSPAPTATTGVGTAQSVADPELEVREEETEESGQPRQPSVAGIVAAGLAVGFLTGFFGVGGGFVIVPALVLVLGLPMQQAVGTSLLIVAANSTTALASRAGTAHFDWAVIVPFTLAAMAATLLGKRVADRLPATQLKRGFAVLLVAVAVYTAWQSIAAL